MTDVNKKVVSVDAAIEAAISATSKSRNAIQAACISIAMHAEKTGDWTKANTLVNGLADSIRKDSLIAWFIKYVGLEIGKSDDGKFTAWTGADHIRNNFTEAKETMWDMCKPASNPWKGFDLKEQVAALVSRANQQAKKHKDAAGLNIDPALLAELAKLAGIV